MEYYIEFIVGILFLGVGLSMFCRSSVWISWYEKLKKSGDTAAIPIGVFALFFGAFLVSFYWRWHEFSGIAVTIIGIISIIKGFFYLLFPACLSKKLSFFLPKYAGMVRYIGLVLALISLFILWSWWEMVCYEDCSVFLANFLARE